VLDLLFAQYDRQVAAFPWSNGEIVFHRLSRWKGKSFAGGLPPVCSQVGLAFVWECLVAHSRNLKLYCRERKFFFQYLSFLRDFKGKQGADSTRSMLPPGLRRDHENIGFAA
jgi:hypothetical protein